MAGIFSAGSLTGIFESSFPASSKTTAFSVPGGLLRCRRLTVEGLVSGAGAWVGLLPAVECTVSPRIVLEENRYWLNRRSSRQKSENMPIISSFRQSGSPSDERSLTREGMQPKNSIVETGTGPVSPLNRKTRPKPSWTENDSCKIRGGMFTPFQDMGETIPAGR